MNSNRQLPREIAMANRDVSQEFCLEHCKYDRRKKRNGKTLDNIQCIFCAVWHHKDFVDLKKAAQPQIWPCPKCCDFHHSISTIKNQEKSLIDSLEKSNETLRKSLELAHADLANRQRECDSLKETLSQLQSKISELESESSDESCQDLSELHKSRKTTMTSAGGVIDLEDIRNDLKRLTKYMKKIGAIDEFETDDEADSEEEDEDLQPQGSLLIGDSIIRAVQSKKDDVEIKCMSGAKLCDVRKTLGKVNPKKKKFSKLYIVCGTNDTTTKKSPEKIAQECEAIMKKAKEISEDVFFSSILPRADSTVDPTKIDNINQLLKTIANDLHVNFVNNDTNFKFQDGTIDETSLLAADKLCLSAQRTLKLLQNLQLRDVTRVSIGNESVNRWVEEQNSTRKENETSKHWNDPLPAPAPPPSIKYHQDEARSEVQPIKFRGPTSSFSNFYAAPLKIWGTLFASNEHAYNFRKSVEMGEFVTAEKIRSASSPRRGQIIAKDVHTNDRWKDMKQSVMYQLLQHKAEQCPSFAEDLRHSSGRLLVEDTQHEYWGRGKNDTGLNMLGRLLMTLRENLPPASNGSPIHNSPSQRMKWPTYPRRDEQQPRCFNCGEKSHNKRTCRHNSPLQCHSCFEYGHKRKFCVSEANLYRKHR